VQVKEINHKKEKKISLENQKAKKSGQSIFPAHNPRSQQFFSEK